MAEHFSIAFEQVELVNGLASDQPVWLFMRATLKDGGNPDVALDVREVGSFPPDANRALPPGYRVDDSGLYAAGLQIAVPARNDIHSSSTGQSFPRFALDSIAVAEGQVLEVEVFMLPRVWFREISISRDDLDNWSSAGFLALLGASGFGLAGAVIGAVLGGLWGSGDNEVEVPCYQTVISARHVFTLDDLRDLASGMRRFGPNDNVAGICGYIDSFYWLSANQHRPWQFAPSARIEPEDCQLEPWRHEPVADWLEGIWLDRDSWEGSCLGVAVKVTSEARADVDVYDHPHLSGARPRAFLRRPIERNIVPNSFSFNLFGDDCPPRSAVPICATCRRFTNLPYMMFMPTQMIAALALGPRHAGAEGWGESMMRRSRETTAQSCLETERLRRLWSQPGTNEAMPLGGGMLFQREGRDMCALWPRGTLSPKKIPDPTISDSVRDHGPRFDDGVSLLDIVFGCFKVPLSQREALFTYAEVPARGRPTCPRLRYMQWNDEGQIVKDVMLQRWVRPPR